MIYGSLCPLHLGRLLYFYWHCIQVLLWPGVRPATMQASSLSHVLQEQAPGAEITAVTSLICLILHSQSSALRLAGRGAEIDIFQCAREPERLLLGGLCVAVICPQTAPNLAVKTRADETSLMSEPLQKKTNKNKAFGFLSGLRVTIAESEDSFLMFWSQVCYNSRFQGQLTDSVSAAGSRDSAPLRWRPIGHLHSRSNVSDDGANDKTSWQTPRWGCTLEDHFPVWDAAQSLLRFTVKQV